MLGKFLDLDLAYENNAAVDVLLNGKMALSVSLPFVQEIYCRRAVELDDNMVAYDDLRERFIRFEPADRERSSRSFHRQRRVGLGRDFPYELDLRSSS